MADPGNLARAVADFTNDIDQSIADLEVALKPHLDKRAEIEDQMGRLDVRFDMGRIDEVEYRDRIGSLQTALERVGKRSKGRETKLAELDTLRDQRAEIDEVVAILEGWDDDTDPRSWASMFGQLSGLKGPDKWRRIVGLCEPAITVGLDRAIDISATLPGREEFTFGIDSEGDVIPTRKPNQFYKNVCIAPRISAIAS